MSATFAKSFKTWLIPCAIVSLSAVDLAAEELYVHWTVPGLTEGRAMAVVLPNVANGTNHMAYMVTAGNLPHGLLLNAQTGAISGTPSEVGNFTVTLRATANDGRTASQEVHITVLPDV